MSAYQLYYEMSGTGHQAVVLLHGLAASGRYWHTLVPSLAPHCRVMTIDLLGFGRSPKPRGSSYSLDDHVHSVMATLRAAGVTSATLVGHSMGALLAAAIAARYPGIFDRLVLVNPPVYRHAAEARRSIKTLPQYLMRGPLAAVVCNTVCRFRPLSRRLAVWWLDLPPLVAADSIMHTWRSYSRSMTNLLEKQNLCRDLAQAKLPVSVLYGSRDPASVEANLLGLKPCTAALSLTKLDCGHHVALDYPETLARSITD